jgi:hypothetical protein
MRTATDMAIRLRTDPPLGALFVTLAFGYGLFCLVIYSRIGM